MAGVSHGGVVLFNLVVVHIPRSSLGGRRYPEAILCIHRGPSLRRPVVRFGTSAQLIHRRNSRRQSLWTMGLL